MEVIETSWYFKTAVKLGLKSKFRFFISIIVIAISISLVVTANGVVDNTAFNYAESSFVELSNADIVIEKSDSLNPVISNVTNLIKSLPQSDYKGFTTRYYMESAILFSLPFGRNATFPIVIVGINFTQEDEIGLGEFNSSFTGLGLNEGIVFGTFGEQLLKRLGANITTRMNLPDGKIAETHIEIVKFVEQFKRFPRDEWNLIVVDLKTIYQFVENDTATRIYGVFKDHETAYSINDIEGTLDRAKNRGIQVQKTVGKDYIVKLPLAEQFEGASRSLDNSRLFLNFIIIIVLIVAGVLIYGLSNISIEEKTYIYGIYRALGLKNRSIISLAFIESLIKGVIGIILGLFFGFVLTNYVLATPDNPIHVFFSTYINAFFTGLILIIISGLYPAFQSTKKQILLAIDISKAESSDFEGRIESYRENWISLKKVIYGLALSSLALFLFVILPYIQVYYGQAAVNNLALILIVMALVGMIFIIIGFLGSLIQQLIVRVFSLFSHQLSFGTKIFLRKNRKRNEITTVIFAISLAFVFFMTTFLSLNLHFVISGVQENIGSDLVVIPVTTTNETLNEDVWSLLNNFTGVDVSFITTGSIFSITGATITVGDEIFFKSFSPAVYGTDKNLLRALFDGSEVVPGSNFTAIENNNSVVLSASMAKALDLGIGDILRVKVSSPIKLNQEKFGKELEFTIVAILNRLPGFPGVDIDESRAALAPIFVGTTTWETLISPVDNSSQTFNETSLDHVQQFYIRERGVNMDLVKLELFLRYGTDIRIIDYELILTQVNRAIKSMLDNLAIILSFSVFIALFAVLTTTSTSVSEARFDIGNLKAIGLRNSVIIKIFILESLIIAIAASILGALAGYLVGYIPSFNDFFQNNAPFLLVIPPDTIVLTFILAFIFAIIGSYIPARKISRLHTMDIFRNQ